MKKYFLVMLTLSVVTVQNSSSQNYDPKYAFTVFYEEFNEPLDSNKWNIVKGEIGRKDFYMWVDDTLTVNQNNSNLELKANYSANYSQAQKHNPNSILVRDYVSGEVHSVKDFTYGIFECSATFEYKKGAFPAFWLYNDDHCIDTQNRPEIDIVEMKYDHSNPTLDYNIFNYPNCTTEVNTPKPDPFLQQSFNWDGQPHTFKCIYKPEKIEFYADSSNYHSYINHGQTGFPDKPMHVVLSQQIIEYNHSLKQVELPSKSSFHWVKVKEFFEVPIINCSSVICSSDSSIFDVDTRASNISWELSPANLFPGSATGTGKIAKINPAKNASGEGKIIYFFTMPGGETFAAEKTFWIGKPDYTLIDIDVSISGDSQQILECGYSRAIAEFNGFSGQVSGIEEYEWELPNAVDWDIYEEVSIHGIKMNHVEIDYREDPRPTTDVIKIKARNTCGWSLWKDINVDVSEHCTYFMDFSRACLCGKTLLTVKSILAEKKFDKTNIWNVEIYDSDQTLKYAKTKRRGKKLRFKTKKWEHDIYAVRVKYNDEFFQGKLVVEK